MRITFLDTRDEPDSIIFGAANTVELGRVFAGIDGDTLVYVGVVPEDQSDDEAFARRARNFPNAKLVRDDAALAPFIERIVQGWGGVDVDLLIRMQGTAFQCAVWQALTEIPKGEVCTYGDIAARIGRPKAVRAVGTANGSNPVSILVPCHRVVPASGGVGGYGWGCATKERLLRAEGVVL